MRILVTIMIFAIAISGCATIRDISETEIENLVITREIAKNYIEIWPMQSGFIRGAMGDRLNEMPAQAIAALDELDILCEQHPDPNEIDDCNLGRSLGLRFRICSAALKEAISQFAPEILRYLIL